MNLGDMLKRLAASAVGEIPLVGDALKDWIEGYKNLPPEERAKLEAEAERLKLEDFKATLADSADLRTLAKAELQKGGFVAHVRPGILAGLAGIVLFWVVIVPLLGAAGVTVPAPNVSAIPSELWWLFGSAYLGYGAYRSFDKSRH